MVNLGSNSPYCYNFPTGDVSVIFYPIYLLFPIPYLSMKSIAQEYDDLDNGIGTPLKVVNSKKIRALVRVFPTLVKNIISIETLENFSKEKILENILNFNTCDVEEDELRSVFRVT